MQKGNECEWKSDRQWTKQANKQKKVHGIRIVENVLASILVWTAIFKRAALWISSQNKCKTTKEKKRDRNRCCNFRHDILLSQRSVALLSCIGTISNYNKHDIFPKEWKKLVNVVQLCHIASQCPLGHPLAHKLVFSTIMTHHTLICLNEISMFRLRSSQIH